MRQPYETLLGAYRDHWFLGPYLTGDVPHLAGIMRDSRWRSLSDGEQLMVRIAWSFQNGGGDVRLAELGRLDSEHRGRVAMALLLTT